MPGHIRVLCPLLVHEPVNVRSVVLSTLPKYIDTVKSGTSVRDPFLHALVEPCASKTSAHDENVLSGWIETIFLDARLFHFRGGRDDDAPDRIACHDDLVGGEEPFHPFVGDADALHPAAEFLVGKPGESVLLLDKRRDVHPCRGPEQGSAGIASDSDRDLRLEFLYDSLCLEQAGYNLEGHAQVVEYVLQIEPALQTHDRQSNDPVARRRHFLHLHLALGPDEQDLGLGILLLQFVRDRDGREDVTSCAASAYYDSQCFMFHPIHCYGHQSRSPGCHSHVPEPPHPAP